MLQLNADPAIAEQQVEAILFYLTTCGYIDSEFDMSEKAFVRAYLRKLVTARIDGRGTIDPQVRFEQIERLHEHYLERFQAIDDDVRGLFHEAVADGEDQSKFVVSQLQLRCYELFRGLSQNDRSALLSVVDDFIQADGVVHPSELEFRNQLAALLGQEIVIDDADVQPISLAVEAPTHIEPREANHPFFERFEHHYTADRSKIRKQLDADLRLLGDAQAQFEARRVEGAGKLAGKATVDDFAGQSEFLDGHVYVVPPKPGRDYQLVVLGDLHGCYSCLKAALLQSDFMEKIRKFRADPDNNPDIRLVLLGDYIDRGRFSYNGVLRTVLKLFMSVPEHVYVLRGNHEYYIEHEGRVYGGVRPAEAINSLSAYVDVEVFERYLEFFERMPNMLLFERMLFVHAGIPRDSLIKERWMDMSSLNDPEIRFQMLWSDPSKADVIPDELQNASARFSYGRLQFRNFMSRIGCGLMVRGHEKVNAGFRDMYPEDDIRLITLFSAGGSANDDLPVDSNYRDVRPMALTIRHRDGETTVTPWAIDYRRYQDPLLNAFFRSDPEIDITPE